MITAVLKLEYAQLATMVTLKQLMVHTLILLAVQIILIANTENDEIFKLERINLVLQALGC